MRQTCELAGHSPEVAYKVALTQGAIGMKQTGSPMAAPPQKDFSAGLGVNILRRNTLSMRN